MHLGALRVNIEIGMDVTNPRKTSSNALRAPAALAGEQRTALMPTQTQNPDGGHNFPFSRLLRCPSDAVQNIGMNGITIRNTEYIDDTSLDEL